MTLIINITTPEGIVLASDSRQTIRNNDVRRVFTDNTRKLFRVNDRVMVGTAGLAFFVDETGIQKNMSKYMDEFTKSMDLADLTVKEVAHNLHDFINNKYPWEQQLDMSAKQLRIETEKSGAQILSLEKLSDSIKFKIKQLNGRIEEGRLNIELIEMIVAGFNKDGTAETYILQSPGSITKKRGFHEHGSTWIGQGDTVARILLGYDAKLLNLPIIKKNIKNEVNELTNQLHGLEYNINWNLMNLQDAVNLAVFLINTTAFIQQYADGVFMDSGDVQGVGGPIDVAIITEKDGIRWIRQKKITYPES